MPYKSLAPSLGAALPNNSAQKVPATVLKIDATSADVQLADGSILRRLKVAGGIAAVGASVEVQFERGVAPVVLAQGGTSGVGGGVSGAVAVSSGSVSGVPTSRQIIAGSGLIGGGDLSADRTLNVGAGDGISVAADTIAVDSSVVRTTRQIVSGAGLTGGGNLSADRTLAIGAGTGIVVNADDVEVNQAYAFNWTARHTFTGTSEPLRIAYDSNKYTSFTADSGGSLIVAPTGDFIFDPAGNDILPLTGYDLNIGSLTKKYLTIHAAELWVETLVAQDTIATIGGRVLVAPTTTLTRDLSATIGSEATITQRGSATTANGSSSATGITFVNATTVYAQNTANITISVPAGTQENHFMVAVVNYWGDLALTAPGGWTQVLTQEVAAGGGETTVFWRIASASEPASYTWTVPFADYSMAYIATYSGVDVSAPINVSAIEANTSSTSAAQTAVTTTVANAMLLYIIGVDDWPTSTASLTATPPSGMTERVELGSGWKFVYLADAIQASAGTTGTKTATLSSAFRSVTALIALKPASNTTQVSVTKPTGVVAGDLLFFAAAKGSSTANLTVPSGFILAGTGSISTGAMAWYYKIATGSEPASYAFSLNTTDDLAVSCTAYYNVDTTSPIEALYASSNQSSTNMTATGITTVSTTARLIFSGAALGSGAGSVTATPPSGMTELVDAGTGVVRIYYAHQGLSTAGLTGDKTATLSSAKTSIAALFALKPVVSGGGGNTIYVKHNQMQAGDIAYMQANGKIEWLSITSSPTTITAGAEYSYTVTRNLDGTGANTWNAGDALVNTGTANSGFIDLYSLESIKGIPLDHIYFWNGSTFSPNYAQESTFAFRGNPPTSGVITYYGVESTPFSAFYHYIQTPQIDTGGGSAVEYWNGSSWVAVPTLVNVGNASYSIVGVTGRTWNPSALTGWAKTTINGVSAYWIRDRITAGTWTQAPIQGQRRVYRDKNTWGPAIAGMVRNSSTFNDIRERWAIGNLSGLYDYATNTYGAAFGDPTKSWMAIDATNGIRVMAGSNIIGRWDTSGNITVGVPTASHLYLSGGAIRLRNGENTVISLLATADVNGYIATFDGAVGVTGSGSFNAGMVQMKANGFFAIGNYTPGYGSAGAPIDRPTGRVYLGADTNSASLYGIKVSNLAGTSYSNNVILSLPAGGAGGSGHELSFDGGLATMMWSGNLGLNESPTFNTGWGDYGGGFQPAKYKKFGDMVIVSGLVKRSSGTNTVIFTLPTGYRPLTRCIFSCIANSNTAARVDVNTNGTVEWIGGGDVAGYLSLNGIIFSVI